MRIGIWQDETPAGGIDAALAVAEASLIRARAEGVDILVFPECFLTGYYHAADTVEGIARTVTPDVLDRLQALADRERTAFVIGSYRPTPCGVANVAFVFRPGETTPLTYTKRALFGDWEKAVFRPGTAPLTFAYRGTVFAVLICFDVEFPELVREAAFAGAQAVLVPTALMAPEDWVPDLIVPTRAIENRLTVAYANRIGTEEHLTFIGKSQICSADPTTRTIAQDATPCLIHARLRNCDTATDYIAEVRRMPVAHPEP